MAKSTLTSKIRHYAIDEKTGRLAKREKPLIAQNRQLVTCRCGRSKWLSVGQLWNCKHKDK